MNNIFIGYGHSDISKAELLAHMLEAQGWSVWWDKKIPPGARFDDVIEEQLRTAKCVIILWSRESVSSHWIVDEALVALELGTLVSVLVDDVKLPRRVRNSVPVVNLSDWKAGSPHPEFDKLLKVVLEKLSGGKQRVASRSEVVSVPKALGKTNVSPKNVQKIEPTTSISSEDEVFVSYTRIDREFVLKPAGMLREKGIRLWVDLWDIPAGADWDKSIDDALHRCTQVLIVLSPASVESDEVRAELVTAFDEKKRIVPILYRECQIPRRLRLIQYIDFSVADPGNEAALQDLILALRGPKHR